MHSVFFFLYIIAITLTCLACSNTATLPAPPPAAATIFTSVIDPVPSSENSLAVEPTTAVQPTFSPPSGLRVLYLRDGNLWFWTEEDQNVLLTDTGNLTALRLSGDGGLLAFMRGPEVWTIHMDGTQARLLITQEKDGGTLSFSPDGSLLAVSTTDRFEVIDLETGASSTILTYPTLPAGYFPQIGWSPDSTGLKTVIPPGTGAGQAEFLYIFLNGKKASLAKFEMVAAADSSAFLSPDGGYVIYVGQLKDGRDSLFLMDSSGAAKPYGDPAESVRAYGWLPDSKHFIYFHEGAKQSYLGDVSGGPPIEIEVPNFESVRWLDMETYLAIRNDNLYLGNVNGGEMPVAQDVVDFDFEFR